MNHSERDHMEIIVGVVLFVSLLAFSVMIGVISSRDEHSREKNAGSM